MFNKSLGSMVDNAYQAMMDANAAEPYNHASYTRCEAMVEAACVLYCKGDQELAAGLVELVRNSGGQVDYLTNLIPEDGIRQHA